jgi:hypothetical protein
MHTQVLVLQLLVLVLVVVLHLGLQPVRQEMNPELCYLHLQREPLILLLLQGQPMQQVSDLIHQSVGQVLDLMMHEG